MEEAARRALSAWRWPGAVRLTPLDGGLINHSFRVDGEDGPLAVLQRLNTAIFEPVVHEDIEAVTAHLAARGLATPRLLRTLAGGLWHEDKGGTWRCLGWVGDRSLTRLQDPADARSAGALVARFHAAVRDLDWRFRGVRAGFHDTDARMGQLGAAVEAHRSHRLYAQVAPLAEALLQAWHAFERPPELPRRVVHGDLKIANVRFVGPAAIALVDLDTLGHGTLDAELGDAWRSWCNPASEDATAARFDLELFEASARGYAEGAADAPPTVDEWASLVPGIERIALELAARFAADALEEAYFGWDPRHGGRGEHNLLRARGQAALARAVRHLRGQAEAALRRARG